MSDRDRKKMVYTGTFRSRSEPANNRQPRDRDRGSEDSRFVRNGSTAINCIDRNDIELAEPYSERSDRTASASPGDAIAMMNGAKFCCKIGKQNIGYYSSKSKAVFDADRQGGVAYEIVKSGKAGLVTLVRVEDDVIDEKPTAAEIIADKVRQQITKSDAPLSPLAKQRAVLILQNSCRDKDISFESFMILFPASNKEQFERLWSNTTHQEEQEGDLPLLRFAETMDIKPLTEAMLMNDIGMCEKLIPRYCDIQSFDKVVEYAKSTGAGIEEKISTAVRKRIAQNNVEQRLPDGDIAKMIKGNGHIKSMIASGNEDGISDYLMSNGYDRREAEELASEMISLSALVRTM